MKSVIGILILASIAGGVVALNGRTRTHDGKSVINVAGEPEITVEMVSSETKTIIRVVQAPGAVEAFAEVDISAEVVGKILEMPVEEGQSVAAGDLLCRLDDADYRARVTSAEANVAKLQAALVQASAEMEKSERDFHRQVQLSEANATSAVELADYQTALVRSKALLDMRKQELIQAQAALQSSMKDLEKTVIRAPIAGIISQRFAKQGEVVVTGTMNNLGTRIMVVSDLSRMQVRCRVDETDAPLVNHEQTARIFLQSDTQKSISGHIFRVATKGTKPVGRDVVTFETLVLVDAKDSRVKPGMTANVEIEVARSVDSLTVPVQALVNRRRRDLPTEIVEQFDQLRIKLDESNRGRAAEYVPIIWTVKDGIAEPRLADTGINDDLSVEVKSGLQLGEQVVIGPYRSLDQLKRGSKVKIKDPPKQEPQKTEAPAESHPNAGK